MRGVARVCTMLVWLVGPPGLAAQSPQFRGDAAHTGAAETHGLEHFGGVAWRFRTGGAVRSTAALADGTLYVGSSDGFLYALAAEDGRERWRFQAGAPIASSPAVTDELVLVASRDGVLHGVTRATGRPRWRLESGDTIPLPWGHEGFDYIHGSAALAHGLAYWGSGDGVLRALDPATGEVAWSFATRGRIRSTPAVSGDLLVFGSGDGLVYALDARTGRERWRFETAGVTLNAADFGYDRRQIFASAAIADGVVYVGSRDASLYALDARDGSELWSFDEESAWVVGSPVVTDDRVFSVRSSSGNVRAIDRVSGEEVWRISVGTFVHASPVLVGDVLHVTAWDGRLLALDAATGDEVWSYRTGGGIIASPVVHEGRLYVGSDDGFIYAFAAAGPSSPRRAVYFDEELAPSARFGSAPAHLAARDHFVARGYELLDAEELVAFMEARAADRAPSVIVFAMDLLPEPNGGDEARAAPLRRYLEAGGKAVWLGILPGYLVRDPGTGQVMAVDWEGTRRALDVDITAYDGDAFTTTPTEAGRRWGLTESWWIGRGTTWPEEVSETLAVDELGRAVVWVQSFGGPAGTGFVHAPPATSEPALSEVERIAEYGLAGRSRAP